MTHIRGLEGARAVAKIQWDPAQAQGVQVGALTCNVESGFGFIVGSSRAVDYTPSSSSGPPQHYVGSIRKLGIDIGNLQSGVMVPYSAV